MDPRTPFILYGDGPRLPSGLARIAKDLALRLEAESDELGIRVIHVGVDYPYGWHWRTWEVFGFQPTQTDQGRWAMQAVIEECRATHTPEPVVLMIMDPSRSYDLTRVARDSELKPGQAANLAARFWGYFPIDAHNAQDRIGGPAAQCVADCERVLAYGRYGAQVLRKTLMSGYHDHQGGTVVPFEPPGPVEWLPHGLDTRTFRPGLSLDHADPGFREWAQQQSAQTLRMGVVATNQPRKDYGLVFATAAKLKADGWPIALWIQTDREVSAAWAFAELVQSFGLTPGEVAITPSKEQELTDTQLAARYGWSDVTIAPGLGEGFGYPIVESLACGTPVIHGDYAGGPELIPRKDWVVEAASWRLEGIYAVQRPIFKPSDVALKVAAAAEEKRKFPKDTIATCSGAVAYLDWQYLWPRWRGWIMHGLQQEVGDDGQSTAVEPVSADERQRDE